MYSLIQSSTQKPSPMPTVSFFALSLGSGDVANMMALGLVKESHGQPAGLLTGETFAWCVGGTRVECGLLWLEGGVWGGDIQAGLWEGSMVPAGKNLKPLRHLGVIQGPGRQGAHGSSSIQASVSPQWGTYKQFYSQEHRRIVREKQQCGGCSLSVTGPPSRESSTCSKGVKTGHVGKET